MTHIFFHIGWVFLTLGIVVMIAGPFFIPGFWLGIAICTPLLIGVMGFKVCINLAHEDGPELR